MIGSIILLIVLIFLNAIFASAEIAVISMNDAKLKKLTEEGNKKAIKLTRLTEQPARFLATIQVVITLAGFLNSAFAADYFADPLVDLFVSLGVPIPRSLSTPLVDTVSRNTNGVKILEIVYKGPASARERDSVFFMAIRFGTSSPKTRLK